MSQSVWKGHIAFGMVSFPVQLCAAARRQTIRFHYLHADDLARVKQVFYCRAEDRPISRDELRRGYEYEKDRYILLEDRELEGIAPRSSQTMELRCFVPAAEIDPVYLDASYYVRPDAVGQRPYTLLFETLRRTGYVGIAQWTHHNREHMVVLRAGRFGLVLHTMYYREEIRSMDEFHTDTSQVSEAEWGLAKMLVEGLAGSFVPSQYSDHYRENLQALIAAKMARLDAGGRSASPALAPVVDIVAALKASLARKKPAIAKGDPQKVRAHKRSSR
jgi:DNA end-binding protein Ku